MDLIEADIVKWCHSLRDTEATLVTDMFDYDFSPWNRSDKGWTMCIIPKSSIDSERWRISKEIALLDSLHTTLGIPRNVEFTNFKIAFPMD